MSKKAGDVMRVFKHNVLFGPKKYWTPGLAIGDYIPRIWLRKSISERVFLVEIVHERPIIRSDQENTYYKVNLKKVLYTGKDYDEALGVYATTRLESEVHKP